MRTHDAANNMPEQVCYACASYEIYHIVELTREKG